MRPSPNRLAVRSKLYEILIYTALMVSFWWLFLLKSGAASNCMDAFTYAGLAASNCINAITFTGLLIGDHFDDEQFSAMRHFFENSGAMESQLLLYWGSCYAGVDRFRLSTIIQSRPPPPPLREIRMALNQRICTLSVVFPPASLHPSMAFGAIVM